MYIIKFNNLTIAFCHKNPSSPMYVRISFVVDGNWNHWSAWTDCSLTCGRGKRSRARLCDNPAPKDGGRHCPGSGLDTEDCSTNECPGANKLENYITIAWQHLINIGQNFYGILTEFH